VQGEKNVKVINVRVPMLSDNLGLDHKKCKAYKTAYPNPDTTPTRISMKQLDIGFEVLTAVVRNSSVFWDITPCSPLEINQCPRWNMPPPKRRLTLNGLRGVIWQKIELLKRTLVILTKQYLN
jgi:hypothetical protein